jgi:hypothetical protein
VLTLAVAHVLVATANIRLVELTFFSLLSRVRGHSRLRLCLHPRLHRHRHPRLYRHPSPVTRCRHRRPSLPPSPPRRSGRSPASLYPPGNTKLNTTTSGHAARGPTTRSVYHCQWLKEWGLATRMRLFQIAAVCTILFSGLEGSVTLDAAFNRSMARSFAHRLTQLKGIHNVQIDSRHNRGTGCRSGDRH